MLFNAIKMQLGPSDEDGRSQIEKISDSIHEIKCDTIIEALGFEPENIPLIFNEPNLEITQWGTLKINFKNMMTSIPGVFAAGDIIRGASLVVWGIRDGRDAAKNIHEFLIKKSVSTNITNEVSLSVR